MAKQGKSNTSFAGGLSVVMPAYNAQDWIPRSIPKVEAALRKAHIGKAEVVVIDDGSSDNTASVAKELKTNYPLRVVSQPNSGRFLARKLGTEKARYDDILFIDTRVFIAENALEFVGNARLKNPTRRVWTSHVVVDKAHNIYARFWDAVVGVAWRKYFSNPRDLSFGIKDFDYYPKGTTCFLVPRTVIKEANDWFESNTNDLKKSNDDTLLIRHIAETESINISPKYYSTYHARTNLKQYIKHVYHRGNVFVDGFLRRDGNRFFVPLVAFLVLSLLVPIVLILVPSLLIPAAVLLLVSWVLELVVVLLMGISVRDSLSLFILSPIFAVSYGLGIWASFIRLRVKPMFNRSNNPRKT